MVALDVRTGRPEALLVEVDVKREDSAHIGRVHQVMSVCNFFIEVITDILYRECSMSYWVISSRLVRFHLILRVTVRVNLVDLHALESFDISALDKVAHEKLSDLIIH